MLRSSSERFGAKNETNFAGLVLTVESVVRGIHGPSPSVSEANLVPRNALAAIGSGSERSVNARQTRVLRAGSLLICES